MIPTKSAISEQAWLLIDNSDYAEEEEIRNLKFRFRPVSLTRIDPASIDRKQDIHKAIAYDNLWLLDMDLVILSKEPIEDSFVFQKHLLLMDSDGFKFRAVYDNALCCSSESDFATRNGLRRFYLSHLFNPKIKYKAAMLFELPDEIDDLGFASAFGNIREA